MKTTELIYIDHTDTDEISEIPESIATCPICGSQLVIVSIEEWIAETGRVTKFGLVINCVTEPSNDNPNWRQWFNQHWSTYVDWVPIQAAVHRWFDERYRVKSSLMLMKIKNER